MRLPISVVIPVKNEEQEIRSLVKNLDFAEEIIFVDNGSSDKTKELVSKTRAKLYYCGEKSFAKLRQFGDQKATHEWVLSMDADMRVTPALKNEIGNVIFESQSAAFRVGRRNIIFGREIKHTDWSPSDDCHVRLYKKAYGQWKSDVHETWSSNKTVTKTLHESFLHYNYKNVEEFVEKINGYSEIAAQSIQLKKGNNAVFPMIFWAVRDFAKRYIYKLGFLDGYHGLMLSYLQAMYYLTLGIKAYEKATD